uniref:Uncharacterized protein n=1 Tax=viral metagenome TaxID=1070528 RepID=A0A6M3XUS3_9ZZZZ
MVSMKTETEQQGKITLEDIENFSRRHGARRTSQIMSILGKRQNLYDAINSEVGQALFKQTMDEIDALFNKHLDGEASEQDIMKYNILKSILIEWARKLATYEKFKLKLTEKEQD